MELHKQGTNKRLKEGFLLNGPMWLKGAVCCLVCGASRSSLTISKTYHLVQGNYENNDSNAIQLRNVIEIT
jgi:hypothetical protein